MPEDRNQSYSVENEGFDQTWEPLLRALNDNTDIQPDDLIALYIRSACLNIIAYLQAIGEGLIENPMQEAQLTTGYWEGYDTLDKFGVIFTNTPLEERHNPLAIAKHVGGQFVKIRGRKLTSHEIAMRHIQELSESTERDQDLIVAHINDPELTTPELGNWMAARAFCNVGTIYLAASLGNPSLPEMK